MRRLSLLHPLLFAIAPILFLVAHNVDEVELGQVSVVLLVAALAAGVIFLAARVALGDPARAALATSLVASVFYGYGRVFDALWSLGVFTRSRDLQSVLTIASVAVLALGFALIRRQRGDPDGLSLALSLGGALLIAMNAPSIVGAILETDSPVPPQDGGARPPPLLDERADRPDIYFIVLDGYARADVLQELYGFDNTPFLAALRDRGFWLGERTRSTYLMTHLSLASTLSMRYLDSDLQTLSARSNSRRAAYGLVRANAVARALQGHGYRYVHFNTNYHGTEHSDFADISYSLTSPALSTEFMSVLLRTTALRPLEHNVAESYLYMLDTVQTVPELTGPTFTFLHLLMPHNPYVFNKDGSVRADIPMTLQFDERTGGWFGKDEYIGQLQYLNTRILEVVDALVARSKVPPIILLESDHGSATRAVTGMSRKDKIAFWKERSANFSAWYAPDTIRVKLTDDLFAVNTFRIVLSTLFGDDLPPLKGRVMASWYNRPNSFKDVTDLVDPPGPTVQPALPAGILVPSGQ